MTISSEGAFDFQAQGIKKKEGFVRSTDGLIIEPAKSFVDGGDHVNGIDSTHAYIHKGHTYCAGYLAEGVANDASIEVLFVTGATYDAHLAIEAAGGGDFYVLVFEGTTTSNDGTGVTERNKVRGIASGDTANVTVTHTPTITGDGNQLGPTRYVPGGRLGGSAGASGNLRGEWVLKPSTKYLVRVTNKSGVSKTLALYAEWYDHDPITAKDQV